MKFSKQLVILTSLAAAFSLTACSHDFKQDNGFQNNAASAAVSAPPNIISASNESETDANSQFLADNKSKAGIKTTASGLQYKINKEGTGIKPNANDSVTVIYEGRLTDGTVFDSTQQQGGKPITFNLNQVIPGWTEGLQLMKEGADYTFYIPADLAYGEQGAGGVIPPNSTLVFDVQLVKVNK